MANTNTWKTAFLPKRSQRGEGSVAKVSPTQQTVDQARATLASPLGRDLQGVLVKVKRQQKRKPIKAKKATKKSHSTSKARGVRKYRR